MDADFLRELVVLAVFVGLYVFGSAFLLRGHTTDLSVVHGGTSPRRSAAGGATGGQPRLNRRRKAIAREQAERAEQQSTGNELDEE